jgi:hypothetical protein
MKAWSASPWEPLSTEAAAVAECAPSWVFMHLAYPWSGELLGMAVESDKIPPRVSGSGGARRLIALSLDSIVGAGSFRRRDAAIRMQTCPFMMEEMSKIWRRIS